MKSLATTLFVLKIIVFLLAIAGLSVRTFHLQGGAWEMFDPEMTRQLVFMYAFFESTYQYLKLKIKADAAGIK